MTEPVLFIYFAAIIWVCTKCKRNLRKNQTIFAKLLVYKSSAFFAVFRSNFARFGT